MLKVRGRKSGKKRSKVAYFGVELARPRNKPLLGTTGGRGFPLPWPFGGEAGFLCASPGYDMYYRETSSSPSSRHPVCQPHANPYSTSQAKRHVCLSLVCLSRDIHVCI